MQSESAQKILKKFGLKTNNFDTFFLVDNKNYFTKSTAALKILKELSGLWNIFYALIIIPKPVRNIIYDLIAKNRYRLFGKSDSCRIPSEAEKKKFI